MKRLKFSRYALVGVVALMLVSNVAYSQFGGLGKVMGGGGGGADWSSIVDSFNGSLGKLGKESAAVGRVIADLADALGLKEEAALMRKEAKNLEEKGDSLGTAELDAYGAVSDSTLEKVKAKLESGGDLSADQKKKMVKAGGKYAKALLGAVAASTQLAKAGQDASKAGAPSMGDGMKAIKAAKNIPILTPKALSFVSKSVSAGQSVFKIMRAKGVALPDLDIDMSDMDDD
jgi:hypothetical protein